ncbi:MAG TPA: hypothetical protein VGP99_11465 [Tepidisphaeraceae bacterium]|nr:hypothetical protein [Tepidisphaeraceae bacterium]
MRIAFAVGVMLIASAAGGQTASVQGRVLDFSVGPYAESLEWVVADSKLIVRGAVESVAADHVTCRVTEIIRGDAVVGAVMMVARPKDSPAPLVGKDTLLFLNPNAGSSADRYPLGLRWREGFIPLDGKSAAMLMNRTAVTSPPEIIAMVRKANAYTADPAKKPVVLSCSTPVGQRCLILPPDDRLERQARLWARNNSVEDRALGLRALARFKSDENIALAKELLADTRSRGARGSGKWRFGTYHVRDAAANLMGGWGLERPDLPMGGPIYTYQPTIIARSWILIPGALVIIALGLGLAPWRGRGAFVAWGIPIACIAAIAGLSILWVRSQKRVDEVMFTSGHSHHEIASYQGGIQYMVMHEWTLPAEMVHGQFDLALFDDVWSVNGLSPAARRQGLGFISANGDTAGPGGVVHPFGLFRLPYWALMAPFVIVLLRQAMIVRRQWKRGRLGLCRRCGYDLRESRGEKCPECGAETEATAAEAAPTPLALQTRDEVPVGGQGVGM